MRPESQAVRVVVARAGQPAEEFVYHTLPIRLGRNPLNELELNDPHVSQWHAVLGQVEGALRIIDVGSRNGTLIGDRRLRRGEAVPLRGSEKINIGPFTLEVYRGEAAAREESRPHRSTGLGKAEAGLATLPDDVSGLPTMLVAKASAEASPAYAPTAPAQASPAPAAGVPAARAGAPAARAGVPAAPVDVKPGGAEPVMAAVHELAKRLTRGRQAPATAEETRAFLRQLGAVLEVFAEHTHSLLRGFERLELDMQLRVIEREHNPVERARSGADLLAVLLEAGREEAGQGTAWLASAFKNVMIKQMALVSGAMAGVRNLLGFLAPQKIDAEARKQGMLVYRLLRSRTLWRTYVEKHETLNEEDRQAFEAIFGPQLSKTYVDLIGESYK